MNAAIRRWIHRLRHPLPRLRSALRCLWFRLLGARIDGWSLIDPGVAMPWPHQVAIGAGSLVGSGTCFEVDRPEEGEAPRIRIGQGCYVGPGVQFNCHGRIVLGDRCAVAAGCRFIDFTHGMRLDMPVLDQPGTSAPIILGRNVWLGANVVVLKGVEIGEGAVIAAGAVVTRAVPAGEVWGGVPARRLGRRCSDSWERLP